MKTNLKTKIAIEETQTSQQGNTDEPTRNTYKPTKAAKYPTRNTQLTQHPTRNQEDKSRTQEEHRTAATARIFSGRNLFVNEKKRRINACIK